MKLKEISQTFRPAIENELQRIVLQALNEEYPGLKEMLVYHLGWEGEGAGPDAQGKRIRPLLVLLCAQAAGGDWKQALPAAAAVELLHNFSLLHDDIQDQSPLRRNRLTVWKKWGVAQAINSGDVLFTLAFMALQDLSRYLPASAVVESGRLLQTTCLRLTEGQYLDISYESKPDLPLTAYWPMIGGKTSALLSCCTELGALTAGASEEQRAAFYEYGYSLGLAFQVLDDWLGIWGDVALTGKSVESDLTTGKKTLPVLLGLAKDGAFACRWREGATRPEESVKLAEMLRAEGVYDETLSQARDLTDKATNALRRAVVEPEAAEALEELTQQLLTRKN